MTRDTVIDIVLDACRIDLKGLNPVPSILLATAQIESGSDLYDSQKKTYTGSFQLACGHQGCDSCNPVTYTDRLDVRKSTICTWKGMVARKKEFLKQRSDWSDWYYYGLHQQGTEGFIYILEHLDDFINGLPDKYLKSVGGTLKGVTMAKNITGNQCGTCFYVREWADKFKNKFETYRKNYTQYDTLLGIESGKSFGILDTILSPMTDIARSISGGNAVGVVILGIGIIISGGIILYTKT